MSNNSLPTPVPSPTPTRACLHAADAIRAAERIGQAMSKSGMFGIKSPEQGLILAMTCVAENITPLEFMRTYHIIQGRPTMRADAMLARFQIAGGKHKIKEYTAEKCIIDFTWNGETDTWEFSIEDAKRAKLFQEKDNSSNWAKYPKAMLFARCVSSGLKALVPALFHGIYLPDELESNYNEGEAATVEVLTTTDSVESHDGNGTSSSSYTPNPKCPPHIDKKLTAPMQGEKLSYDTGHSIWQMATRDLMDMQEQCKPGSEKHTVLSECITWRKERRQAINRVKECERKIEKWATEGDDDKLTEWHGKLTEAVFALEAWEMYDIPNACEAIYRIIYAALDGYEYGPETKERMMGIAADLEREVEEATAKGGAK